MHKFYTDSRFEWLRNHKALNLKRGLEGPSLIARLVQARLPKQRLSSWDKLMVMKQLSSLLNAEIPLAESIQIIEDNAQSHGLKRLLRAILVDIQSGRSLARSLTAHPTLFREYEIGVIAVGEATGTLPKNLTYLAAEMRKRREMNRKVMGALLYPIIIAVATLLLAIFLILYLFPKLVPIFLSMRVELPLSTRLIITATNFLQRYWWALISALVLVFISLHIVRMRSKRWRLFMAKLALQTPLLKACVKHYNVAEGARSLALLLKSGMPTSFALNTLAGLTKNPLYKSVWEDAAATVEQGGTISSTGRKYEHLFPPLALHMIAVGERSGDLGESLLYVAEVEAEELDASTKTFSTLLEPALMVSMGLLIGLVAISIITPIYGLSQHIQS